MNRFSIHSLMLISVMTMAIGQTNTMPFNWKNLVPSKGFASNDNIKGINFKGNIPLKEIDTELLDASHNFLYGNLTQQGYFVIIMNAAENKQKNASLEYDKNTKAFIGISTLLENSSASVVNEMANKHTSKKIDANQLIELAHRYI